MIEPIVFLAIGVFVASLLGLILIPVVQSRAVRLTMKRLEAATPLSMAEIQADKDELRAEFAMSTRRLESAVEQLKAKTVGQFAELGRKADVVNRLKIQMRETTASLFALEAREQALRDQVAASESAYSTKITTLRDTERMVQKKQAELAQLAADLEERSATAYSQRVEAVALRAQMEALKDLASGHEREANELSDRLTRARKEKAAATAQLQEQRDKTADLSDRVSELERQLVAQTTEVEVLRRRAQEVNALTTDRAKVLSQLESELAQLRQKSVKIEKIAAQLRTDLSGAAGRSKAATESLSKEKALVEDQLNKTKAERIKLQQEIASIKREAEEARAAGRVENALLRDRIKNVAAEFAQLALALDGPDSPIEAIMAGEATLLHPEDGDRRSANSRGEANGDLVNRIRTLQMK
jgi:chromosome segregation ATPase